MPEEFGTPSKYDELHDRFFSLLSTKQGTRYERLAAIVFKVLDENQVVIHDVKITGDADVKHQIDVVIERQGQRRRVLIECKDFDVAKKKVGQPTVVHFFGVVTDVGADEAYILTCNGFSKNALKFAKSKHIRCLVLRDFRESDWENRVRKIVVQLYAILPKGLPRFKVGVPDQRCAERLSPYLNAGEIFDASMGSKLVIPINKFIESQMNALKHPSVGQIEVKIDVGDAAIEIGSDRIPINQLALSYEFERVLANTITVEGNSLALLLLQGLDDADMVVWDRDLEKYNVDDHGEVIAREGNAPN